MHTFYTTCAVLPQEREKDLSKRAKYTIFSEPFFPFRHALKFRDIRVSVFLDGASVFSWKNGPRNCIEKQAETMCYGLLLFANQFFF